MPNALILLELVGVERGSKTCGECEYCVPSRLQRRCRLFGEFLEGINTTTETPPVNRLPQCLAAEQRAQAGK